MRYLQETIYILPLFSKSATGIRRIASVNTHKNKWIEINSAN